MSVISFSGPLQTASWDAERWPNFSAHELACPCCGKMVIWAQALDAIQALRNAMGVPLTINSGHRCALHNARVGGAPLSQHKQLAFDVALGRHDCMALFQHARACGFTGFGFGNSFLHLDTRSLAGRTRPAFWFYGKRSFNKWRSLGLSVPL
jgi:hypothetical protein